MRIVRFEELECWKEARVLTILIYALAKGEVSRDFGLKDQIQRAAVSVMANIAEGLDGGSDRAFISFLNYAYRSATEVQSLLYVAVDVDYVPENGFQ